MSAHKVYRVHFCEKEHRTFVAAAKCIFREGSKVRGDGAYAFVHRFRVGRQYRRQVELCSTLADAEEAMARRLRSEVSGKRSGTCIGHEVIMIASLDQLSTVARAA
jgi:hypothetical protein